MCSSAAWCSPTATAAPRKAASTATGAAPSCSKPSARTRGFDDALLLDLDALAGHFTGKGPWKKRLPQLLDTLAALGRARCDDQRWRSI